MFEKLSYEYFEHQDSSKREPGLYYYEKNMPIKILTLSNLHEKNTVKVPERANYLLIWHEYPEHGILSGYHRGGRQWHRLTSELQLLLDYINCPL